jgi:hypothetical protein
VQAAQTSISVGLPGIGFCCGRTLAARRATSGRSTPDMPHQVWR